MSRFFATGGSDSESDSSSEDELIVQRPAATNFTFSDDEEEVKRVVRSTKEKRYEDITNLIKTIRNHKKIKDMSSCISSFEELVRAYQKALPVITKEENGVTPRFYVRALAELEDFITDSWENRNTLTKNSSKQLGTLRQKVRKYIKDFETDLAKFRVSSDQEDEDEEEKPEEEEESSEDEAVPTKAVSFKKDPVADKEKKAPKYQDDSDDSIDWGSESDSDSDESDDEAVGVNIRERFLKKATDKEYKDDDAGEKKKKKVKEGKIRRRHEDDDDDDEGWEMVTKGPATSVEKPKMFAKDAEIDIGLVLNKLNEIMAGRGKKRTDRRLQIDLMYELRAIAELHNLGDAVAAKIRFNIISALYDYNPKVSEPMKLEFWTKLLEAMVDLVTILLGSNNITMSESVMEENEEYETAPFFVRGCALTAVERLDDEFTKFLKESDPHSNNYVDRLKDEIKVTNIIEQVLKYVTTVGTETEICRIYLRKIDHIYYKFDPMVLKKKNGETTESTSVDEMEKLSRYIYTKDNTDRLRTRAILCHIYHHAMHDNWFQARDLLLMSHLQENIHHSDPATQILYNRTMANLGLCAFRQGNIKDAHQCLVDLMMTSKPKELLAQGLLPQRQHERSAEQEKVEKQRLMPFHMHINLELLECVYLVSAMLLEIPYMAAHEFDARRRMISKTFYQQLRSSERQSLVGPPESMREHVVAAAKAMRCGNWNACATFIVNTKMNAKVWDLFYESDRVREMLTKFIKEESLRTYLFTYSNVYTSISIPSLALMFELPKEKVHSLISKMIINEELMASLDDPTGTVVLHRSEPSRLQALSMQLADKVTNLVDANERIFEMKQGNMFSRNNQFGGKGQRGDRGNYRNQNRGGEGGGGGGGGGGNWNNQNRRGGDGQHRNNRHGGENGRGDRHDRHHNNDRHHGGGGGGRRNQHHHNNNNRDQQQQHQRQHDDE